MKIYCGTCDKFLADLQETAELPEGLETINFYAVCPKCNKHSYKCQTNKMCRLIPREGFVILDCIFNNSDMIFVLGENNG